MEGKMSAESCAALHLCEICQPTSGPRNIYLFPARMNGWFGSMVQRGIPSQCFNPEWRPPLPDRRRWQS